MPGTDVSQLSGVDCILVVVVVAADFVMHYSNHSG